MSRLLFPNVIRKNQCNDETFFLTKSKFKKTSNLINELHLTKNEHCHLVFFLLLLLPCFRIACW